VKSLKMADDIDEIMAMIQGMQTQDNSIPTAEKENIGTRTEMKPSKLSANDELNSIMKSLEDIKNTTTIREEAPSKPSRQNVAPPQKPTRKKKVVVENNEEKVEVEVKKVDQNQTRTGSVSSESTGRTTTQDIDHLLKDLEKNIHEAKRASEGKKKDDRNSEENPLDAMLDDMINTDNMGVTPTSKGTCPTCNRPVMGEAVVALGKVWHREHFVCTIDDKEIGNDLYFSWNDQIYCESHYNELFSPQCAKCGKPILDDLISALDKTYHRSCFTCFSCDRPFTDIFHEHERNPYCQECYSKCIAPKCVSCGEAILSTYTAALGGYWHPQCFICQEPGCGPFKNGKFFELNGKPYCETHYLQRIGASCAQCKKPISGRCVSAMGKRFHPNHFICNLCKEPLTQGIFKEHAQRAYCHPCFRKVG